MAAPVLTGNVVTGSISWTAFNIQYLGVSYAISAGSTTKKYTYWLFNGGAGGALQSSDTFPSTLTDDDLLLFLNKHGVPVNAQRATVIDGSLLVPESVLTESLAAKSITAEKVYITGAPIEWLANGSLDNGLAPHTVTNQVTSWSNDATMTRTGTGASLKLVLPATNTGWDNPILYFMGAPTAKGNHLPVKQGQTVHGEVWMRAPSTDGPESVSAGLIVKFYDASGAQIGLGWTSTEDYSPTSWGTYDAWNLITVDAVCDVANYGTASANVAYAVMSVVNSFNHAGATLWLDDASFYAKMDGSLIVDGSIVADTLEDNLEITNHFIAPQMKGIHDWSLTAPTLTLGAMATTGGTLSTANKYKYWVQAKVNGLWTPVSTPQGGTTSPTTNTSSQPMSWTAVTGATAYRVWRWAIPNAGGTIGEGSQTLGVVTSFTDTGAGWGGGTLSSTASQARVDINSTGINQFDALGNKTTFLGNDGGATFYQQTSFGMTPGDSHEMVMRVEGSAVPGDTSYSAFINFLPFTNQGGMLSYDVANDGTEQISLSQNNGSNSKQILLVTEPGGSNIMQLRVGLYTFLELDDTTVTLEPAPTGSIKLQGPVSIIAGSRGSGMGFVPVGAMEMYGGSSAPSGWLLCQGQSVSRTTYADLFAVIGTSFGSVDSTHFNLPDMRGRFPLGGSPGASTKGNVGDYEGGSSGTAPGAGDPARLDHRHTHGVGSSVNLSTNTTTGGTANRISNSPATNWTDSAGVNGNAAYHALLTLNFIIFAGV